MSEQYIAVTMTTDQIGPDSWETYPACLRLTRDSTIGEVADWMRVRCPSAKTMPCVWLTEPDPKAGAA